ncbi:MAG: N-acetylneuraminate synthase [Prevotella sp.]|nr:N-acetylneuraminate synthase [Prevotella sp.]MCM1075445.1 N-acetylneuraminate synthase [Ruminococcus sp.]
MTTDFQHVIIIAEAGVNHNGSLQRAREMVLAAKAAGADYVKFQTAVPELVISTYAPKAEYQKDTDGEGRSQLEMCKAIHLPLTDYTELKALCEEVGIGFMSTPFDLVSIDVLNELGQDFMKVPSGEITNLPYLRKIAAGNSPVIISTGMATLDEIRAALDILTSGPLTLNDITVLHCNTEYPTPMRDVNLKAMTTIGRELGVRVGYSDHTRGIEVPIAAVALGAQVIEKHFTLSRELPGPDHRASLEPDELAAMVRAIRNIEQALGDGEKRVSQSERKNMAVARKSIVALRPIKKGEAFTEENVTVKRPGNGVSPMLWDEVMGQTSPRDFAEDEPIELATRP